MMESSKWLILDSQKTCMEPTISVEGSERVRMRRRCPSSGWLLSPESLEEDIYSEATDVVSLKR